MENKEQLIKIHKHNIDNSKRMWEAESITYECYMENKAISEKAIEELEEEIEGDEKMKLTEEQSKDLVNIITILECELLKDISESISKIKNKLQKEEKSE